MVICVTHRSIINKHNIIEETEFSKRKNFSQIILVSCSLEKLMCKQ